MKIRTWTSQNLSTLNYSIPANAGIETFRRAPLDSRPELLGRMTQNCLKPCFHALAARSCTSLKDSLLRALQRQKGEIVRLLTSIEENRDVIAAGRDDISRCHSTPLTRQPDQPLCAVLNT